MSNKTERQVAAIKNGTVIDHIPAEKTYQVVNLLQLETLDTPVTIGYNYPSNKIGRKGIIKVSDKFFTDEEISRLSVVAQNVVLNIIHDYEVVEKKTVKTPDELRGIVKCNTEVHHQQRADAHRLPRREQGEGHPQMPLLRQGTVHRESRTRLINYN